MSRRGGKWDPLFLSECQDWETPPDLLARLYSAFEFDLDVCANRANVKAARFYSPEDDGLSQPWLGTCCCNPPYSEVGTWVGRARDESEEFASVVLCLTFARTDTAWSQEHIPAAAVVTFIRGRLKFVGVKERGAEPRVLSLFGEVPEDERVRVLGSKDSATAPSALILFGQPNGAQIEAVSALGWTVVQEPPL